MTAIAIRTMPASTASQTRRRSRSTVASLRKSGRKHETVARRPPFRSPSRFRFRSPIPLTFGFRLLPSIPASTYLRSVLGARRNLGDLPSPRKSFRTRKDRYLHQLINPHFHSDPCSLWKAAAAGSLESPRMPHVPRPPSFDHGFISFLWAVGLGAFIYFGSVAVGVSSGTAFVFAALAAFGIFLFVRVYGEETPPRRQAPRRG